MSRTIYRASETLPVRVAFSVGFAVMLAHLMLTTLAVAQVSSPWAASYETPLVSTVNDKFLERVAESVGMDPRQMADAHAFLRAHGQRWNEFVARARSRIVAIDDSSIDLRRASYRWLAFMAEREAKLERIVDEQLALDRQVLEELRTVLREDQMLAWSAIMDTIAVETMRRGPSLFREEHLCLASILRDANIDPERVVPVDRRARVLGVIDGWRSSAALAARNVVEFRTAQERSHHRDLLPHAKPDDEGGLLIDSASPGYGDHMRKSTLRLLQVHAAARDTTRQAGQAVAAALGEGESLSFLREYWLAAIPADDRHRFEDIATTIDLVLTLKSVDEATKRKVTQAWNGLSAVWIERARALVDGEDRIAEARIGKGDPERAARDAQRARSTIREMESVLVSSLIEALGEQATSTLDSEGVPAWIRASVPSG